MPVPNCVSPEPKTPEKHLIKRLVVSKKAYAQYMTQNPEFRGTYKELALAFIGVEVTRMPDNSPYFFCSYRSARYVFVVWKGATGPEEGKFTLVNIQEARWENGENDAEEA